VNPGTFLIDNRFYQDRTVNVAGDATLELAGGLISARDGNSGPVIEVGGPSAATFALAAGTTSTIDKSPTENGGTPTVQLHGNATVMAGAGSVLQIGEVDFINDMTDPTDFGLSDDGTVKFVANGMRFEALTDDNGNGPSIYIDEQPFHLNALAFADFGVDPVLELWDNTNNDGALADAALYVKTLDLSDLASGRVVDLTGLGGAERLYYGTLVNPNGASFADPAKFLPAQTTRQDPGPGTGVIPEPLTGLLIPGALAGLVLRRRGGRG
jgi:hypothetical protein